MILLLSFSALADFSSTLAQLQAMRTADQALMKKAEDCLPKLKNGAFELCTGAKIEKSSLSRDLEACRKKIEDSGYQTITDNSRSLLSGEDYGSYVRSSKRAETFHDAKVVVFKPKLANRIDCLHEFIHVQQWTSGSKTPLAPTQRLLRAEQLQTQLLKAVDEIKKSELAKESNRARAQSEQLKLYIDHLNDWNALSDWLDEKEAHYIVFTNCDALNCSLTDLDVATANLVKRKDHLPKSFHPELERKAKEVLQRLEQR